METAWIQVFVLTLSECVAPAGKTVCQEREFELEFLTRTDCVVAMEQLVALKDESPSVIVNRDRSGCTPSARERSVFASLEQVRDGLPDRKDWKAPDTDETSPGKASGTYQERLASLKTCEESKGVAPCKVGEIIVEAVSGDPVDVWKTDE